MRYSSELSAVSEPNLLAHPWSQLAFPTLEEALAAYEEDPERTLMLLGAKESVFDALTDCKKAVPTSSNIALISDEVDIKAKENVELLLEMINGFAMAKIMKDQGGEAPPVNTTEQKVEFMTEMTNTQFAIITQHLASFLNFKEYLKTHFEKTETSVELHLSFLKKLFSPFKVPKETLELLDLLLTEVFNDLKVSVSQTKRNIRFQIFLQYKDDDPVIGRVVGFRMFFLNIDAKSWNVTVGKSSVKKVTFVMDIAEYSFRVNNSAVDRNRERMLEMVQRVTGAALDDLEAFIDVKDMPVN